MAYGTRSYVERLVREGILSRKVFLTINPLSGANQNRKLVEEDWSGKEDDAYVFDDYLDADHVAIDLRRKGWNAYAFVPRQNNIPNSVQLKLFPDSKL